MTLDHLAPSKVEVDHTGPGTLSNVSLKKNQTVQFEQNGGHYEVEILMQARKVTGKYSNSFNAKYRSPASSNKGYVTFDLTATPMNSQESRSNDIIDFCSNEDIIIVDNTDFTETKSGTGRKMTRLKNKLMKDKNTFQF